VTDLTKEGWITVEKALGKLYPSKCPECGNVDNLTEDETKKTVHCQRCYRHYEYNGGCDE
jgi:predicted Zn-ribbon and HTH transcriptional regulator